MPPSSPQSFGASSGPLPTTPDLLIVGGGVVGLWCAVRAAERGLSAVLVEKGAIGQGASGGFLGALIAHQPAKWNAKKAFQLEALIGLEKEVASLEAETGVGCGYRRCGRLMPVETQAKLHESSVWQRSARDVWPEQSPAGAAIGWELLKQSPNPDWLWPSFAPHGCDFETLGARIDPRGLLKALTAKVVRDVRVVEHCRVVSIAPEGRAQVRQADGSDVVLSPGHIIVAGGYETFDLLRPVSGHMLGSGVKGQTVLLKPRAFVPADQPIVYRGGLYVIRHENGLLAVGSTSEKLFDDATAVDDAVDELVARAVQLCPVLEGAKQVEAWAGVRPRAVGREPMIGPLPEAPRVIVATGGFKITLGIAHRMADAALDFAAGGCAELPNTFTIDHHFSCL